LGRGRWLRFVKKNVGLGTESGDSEALEGFLSQLGGFVFGEGDGASCEGEGSVKV
jgi:hypothetical protein